MLVVIFLCLLFTTEVNYSVNLVLNKSISIISENDWDGGSDGWKAVDGIIGSNERSCFESGPFFKNLLVHLDRDVRIERVVVHGRVDCCGQWWTGATISLLPQNAASKESLCHTYGEARDGEKMNFICEDQFEKSELVVIVPNPKIMVFICEIEVYERELKTFGCFEEVIKLHGYYTTEQTIDECLQWCHSFGGTFAALEDGRWCICSDEISKRMPATSCSIRCVGSPSNFCGGPKAYSVYTGFV